MPYIKEEDRQRLRRTTRPTTVGELNYLVTKMIIEFLGPNPNYADFNGAVGALECCKLELVRRMVSPYEDAKIEENGDVYP